jgi:hypothetical protein
VLPSNTEATSSGASTPLLTASASAQGLGYVNLWGYYSPYGQLHCSSFAEFVSGDTNPNLDWYLVQSTITCNPGPVAYGSSWQINYHNTKFSPYCYDGSVSNPTYVQRSIIQGSPGTTPSGGSASVSIGSGGASGSWTYPLNDITCYADFSHIPSYTYWRHEFAYSTNSSVLSTTQVPGYVEQVPQGKYCKVSAVATAAWHYFNVIYWADHTQNNIWNTVIMWAHP